MISQEALKNVIDYDKSTGAFCWKRRRLGVRADLTAGFKMKNGYIGICIDQQQLYAHRLAWVYVYGSIPEGMRIDHINGVSTDNRIENLRIGTQAQNTQNLRQAKSHNKSTGILGVRYRNDKKKKKYLASIQVNGKSKCLGYYLTSAEAKAAYLAAKRTLHEFCSI